VKAAWNRTTIHSLEYSIKETLPSYRHVCRDEQYKIKAIVHQSLLELSRLPPRKLLSSPFIHDSFMRLFRLYTNLLVDEYIPDQYYDNLQIEKIPQEFNVTCSFCRTNIWNRFLTCRACQQLDSDGDVDSYDVCLECFARGRSCRDITNLDWIQQEKWSDLIGLWERCRGIYEFLGGEDIGEFHTEVNISLGRKTLACVCVEEIIRRPDPHSHQEVPVGLCHTCKVRQPDWKMVYCTMEKCRRAYCFGNLFRQFDEEPFDVLSRLDGYICPVCRGICNCGACRKRKDQDGYVPKLRTATLNARLIADKRSVESLVETSRKNTRVFILFNMTYDSGTLSQKARYQQPILKPRHRKTNHPLHLNYHFKPLLPLPFYPIRLALR
jgi:Zinc-finger domain of monoamine-oxidase A repressor R1